MSRPTAGTALAIAVATFAQGVYYEMTEPSDHEQVPISAIQLSLFTTDTGYSPRTEVYDTILDEPRSVLGSMSNWSATFPST
jgi:hypothetical protein